MLNITDVRVIKIKGENNLKGVASITIDKCFVIHNIKIFEGRKGFFIAFPSERDKSKGGFRDIVHPIDTATRQQIVKRIKDRYDKL